MLILSSIYIFVGYILLCASGHDPKSSLTFVIDDTYSMHDDIAQVKMKTNDVFDAVLKANASKIDDFILVTFNDPGTEVRTITRDRDEFKRALEAINVHGGGDCPELSMAGIELALEKSKPNSYFYVFTDASAKDFEQFERVKSLSQKKSTQVSFLLTGYCGSLNDQDYVVFDKLADATSGQVFHIKKNDIHKIIDYIIASITHKKTTLGQKFFDNGYGRKLSFTVDSKLWDVMVSVSAVNPTFNVVGPDGNPVESVIVADTAKTAIRKLKTNPGVYTINLFSTGSTSVVVTGSTSICFEHGFSTITPASIKETSTMPVPGIKSYLSIALNNEKRDITFKTVELRDLENNVIKELPITLLDEDKQFYTTDPFDPPNQLFKIAINGFTPSGEKITRLSATTVQPQKPELETKTRRSPAVTILNDANTEVNYNQPFTVKCKLHGFPQPDVMWMDTSGLTYPSTVVPIDLPYDYMSVLTIDKVTKNSTITCKAINSEGEDSKSVNVVIKNYFNILEYPKDITIEYGKTADMKFIIDAFPPATITWYKNDKEITMNGDYNISPDNTILTLKTMHPKLKGKYSVKAVNENEEKKMSFNVFISGVEKPVIDKNQTTIFVKENSDVDLQCRLIKGKPKPVISWVLIIEEDENSSRPSEIELDETGETYHIDNVKLDDSRKYKCTARNEIGEDSHVIELYVEYPPSIEEDDETITVMNNNEVTLVCSVDGFPFPEVRWFKNNTEIASKYLTHHDNILRFRATIDDIGVYTCEASNALGRAKRNIEFNVYVPVQVESPNETILNILVGSRLVLPCVTKGYPTPEVKWKFNGFDSKVTPRKLRADRTDTLVIPRAQIEDEGFYTCEARNFADSVFVTYEVHVLAYPSIENKLLDKTLRAVEGDLVLRIPCKAIGRPKPTVSWTVDGLNIAIGSEWYDIEGDGTLLIKNVKKRSAGAYKCTAQNSLGSVSEEFYVDVQPYPRSTGFQVKELYNEGTLANIKCDQPHSDHDVVRWYKNGRLIKIGEISIPNISLSDSGLYSCRVSNFISSHSSHKMIVVGRAPVFATDEETNIEFYDGATVFLECGATGDPTPRVTWSHNGHKIEETSESLTLHMKSSDIGEYTCNVSNDFGTISRTYNINVEDCMLNFDHDFNKQQPLLLSLEKSWPIFETSGGFLRIPKNQHILVACPESHIYYDGFSFGEIRRAMCSGKTKLKILGKDIDFKDLKCKKEVNKPLAKSTGQNCQGVNTELLLVGFNLRNKFLAVYDVCFDKTRNVTIYTKYNIHRSLADSIPKEPIEYVGSKYLPHDFNNIFKCEDKCCFAKRQLVNPRDVSVGFQQVSTYNDLNVLPHWSTCGTENWDEVEQRVRSFVKYLDYKLVVWTGAAYEEKSSLFTFREKDSDRPTPRYLWKVIQDLQEQQALAIIQVNIPNLNPREARSHMLCRDVCNETEWMRSPDWRDVSKGFTYCCRLDEFKRAFGYNDLFAGPTNILRKVPLISEHSLT